jgi:integrase
MSPRSAADAAYEGSSFPFTEARVAAACKAASPEDADAAGRRSWRDESCKGLTLVVNLRSGSAAYYYQGKANGQTTRRAIGDVDVVRLEEARQTVNRIRFDASFAAAAAPRPSEPEDAAPDGSDASPVVKAVMDAYIEAHAAGRWLPGTRTKTPTDRTMENYRDLRRAVMSDKKTREEFELLTLQVFADRLPAIHAALSKRAPIQANRAVQLWRNMFAYAADAGIWTKPNPAVGTGKADRLARTTEQSRQRVLNDAEWKRLDTAMMAEDPLWRDLFTWSLLTLQRMGACCRARWEDIVMTGAAAEWTIPAEDMKGRRSGHVVPLAGIPAAIELLRARRKAVPKSCPWVFPGADLEPARNYDKAWRRILERAKLWTEDRERRLRPHDLRRTGGSRMVTAGVPLNVVTRALGDAPSSVAMVAKTYAVVVDEALKDAFKAIGKRGSRRRSTR